MGFLFQAQQITAIAAVLSDYSFRLVKIFFHYRGNLSPEAGIFIS